MSVWKDQRAIQWMCVCVSGGVWKDKVVQCVIVCVSQVVWGCVRNKLFSECVKGSMRVCASIGRVCELVSE